mgnify:CR=1 FL=1
MKTSLGDIKLELFCELCPKTCKVCWSMIGCFVCLCVIALFRCNEPIAALTSANCVCRTFWRSLLQIIMMGPSFIGMFMHRLPCVVVTCFMIELPR